MSFGGGGSGSTTTTQKFEPPGYTQGAWQDYLNQAQNLTSQPYQQYDGMQVAPQSTDTGLSQNMVNDIAFNSAPDVKAGRGASTDIASGAYLNNSPWTSADYTNRVIQDNANNMAQASALGTRAQTDSAFARDGSYGGSAWAAQQAQNAQALDNSVGQMANQYRLQNANMGNSNYMQGIGQMLQGAQLGYGGQGLDLQAAQALNGSGQQQNQYTQSLLSNQQQNFNQQQQYPYQQLQTMLQSLSGASGNYGTNTSNPYQGSTVGNLLGLGALGLGGYQAFTG